MKHIIVFNVIAACLFGCVSGARNGVAIPDGAYHSGGERITIEGKYMSFVIKPNSGRFKGEEYVESFKYPYSVNSDGKIKLLGSSNDSVYSFEISRYSWVWGGGSIIRSDGVKFRRR